MEPGDRKVERSIQIRIDTVYLVPPLEELNYDEGATQGDCRYKPVNTRTCPPLPDVPFPCPNGSTAGEQNRRVDAGDEQGGQTVRRPSLTGLSRQIEVREQQISEKGRFGYDQCHHSPPPTREFARASNGQ